MSSKSFTRVLEWESIEFPLSIGEFTSKNRNYNIPQPAVISVWRNDQFKLIGNIVGNSVEDIGFDYQAKDSKNRLEKGDVWEAIIPTSNVKYIFSNCWIRKSSFDLINDLERFKLEISIGHVSEIRSTDEIEKINEWYLTSRLDLIYPRRTQRSFSNVYTKQRIGLDEDPPRTDGQRDSSWDSFFVDAGSIKFYIQNVHKDFLPEWANGITIEYRKSLGIPDEETRKAISELVGFVLGCQLLTIGSTSFNNKEHIVERSANNPWGTNVISKCSNPAHPPVFISKSRTNSEIEQTISSLIPSYLSLRKPLNLSDALWKYWISRDGAIGTNLPILSSAMEALADNYVRHYNLGNTFSENEKNEYRALIAQEISALEEKLKSHPIKDRIINNLRNPFNLGVMQKLQIFFKNIGIEFDKSSIESEALRSRNIMAHASIEFNDESMQSTFLSTRAYETLFHRTILKILGHTGRYIDYHSADHRERELTENM